MTEKSRETFLELCALSRNGDAAARERVAAWTPWPTWRGQSGSSRARRTPLRRAPSRIRRAELDLRPARRGMRGNVCLQVVLLAATDEKLILDLGKSIAAIDLASLSVSWTLPTDAPVGFKTVDLSGRELPGNGVFALLGNDVIYGDAASLVLHDGATGEVLKRITRGDWLDLEVDGDRALALNGLSGGVAVLDLGERFGTVVGTTAPGTAPGRSCHLGLAGPLGFDRRSDERRETTLEAMDLATGRMRWRRPIELNRHFVGWQADERGIVFLDPDRRLFEVDPATLARRWGMGPTAVGAALARDHAVYLDKGGPDGVREVGVIDRATGQVAWKRRRPAGGTSVAGDVLFSFGGELLTRMEGIDLLTGDELFSVDLFSTDVGLPPPVKEGWVSTQLVPLERSAVLVAAQSGSPVTIVVFEE